MAPGSGSVGGRVTRPHAARPGRTPGDAVPDAWVTCPDAG